jgi:hypothetical protein
MGFKFQPISKVPFLILDENDVPIKEYSLDIGSEDSFRAMTEKGTQVVHLAQGLETGAASFDELKDALKDFVDGSLGTGEFIFLYKKFDSNIFAMIELARAVTLERQKALQAKIDVNKNLYG